MDFVHLRISLQIKHRICNQSHFQISVALLLGPSVDSAGRGDDRLWLLGSGAKLANTFAYHVIMFQKSSNAGDAKKSLHQNWLSIHLGFKVLYSIPDFHNLPGPSWTQLNGRACCQHRRSFCWARFNQLSVSDKVADFPLKHLFSTEPRGSKIRSWGHPNSWTNQFGNAGLM